MRAHAIHILQYLDLPGRVAVHSFYEKCDEGRGVENAQLGAVGGLLQSAIRICYTAQ